MTTFLLLHGGQHGAWCWRRVEPLLQALGHGTVAPDLPMHDPAFGAREWARLAASSVPPDVGDLVVVAHSKSGLALPLIPEFRPVRRLVGLSALLAQPGVSFAEYSATRDGADALLFRRFTPGPTEEVRGEDTTWEVFRTYYAHDCPEADARWAWEQLRRSPLTAVLEAATIASWPAVPTTSIVMQDDRIVNPTWSRRVAAKLGADVIELPGGHSPFFAKPELLASTLASLAAWRSEARLA